MREIKFRAWDKEENRMWFNVHKAYDTITCHCKNEHDDDCEDKLCVSSFGSLIDKDQYELMQYTGLKDKNGKEIYEGDICKSWDGTGKVKFGEHQVTYDPEWFQHDQLGFYLQIKDSQYGMLRHTESLEIIGNIYENPELLDASKTNA